MSEEKTKQDAEIEAEKYFPNNGGLPFDHDINVMQDSLQNAFVMGFNFAAPPPLSEPLKSGEEVVEMCKAALLKQLHLMVHENGYPSEAVPKATILALPALMKSELKEYSQSQRATMEWPSKEEIEKYVEQSKWENSLTERLIDYTKWLRSRGKEGSK